ncbi:MAG: SDR family NAD(P)-dependent oxidoreductase [Neisseriaceae bacterium]|nr:SDR family NAD(P)-dependent oxidoreductase [Neisseriaceae bacterium]MBP6861855.1 SDR family NAD(P)-dependent oxidoreductase [Neisseriaceae bacterium]
MKPAKTAYIVTGASQGIGAEFVSQILAQQAPVFGISRRPADIQHPLYQGASADLSQPFDATALVQQALSFFGQFGLDTLVLINNAGTVAPMAISGNYPETAVATAIHLNLTAPILLSNAFIQLLPPALHGKLLHISSGAAQNPYPGWGVYGASKAGIDHFSRIVQKEHPALCSVAMYPGVVNTGMQAEIRAQKEADFPNLAQFIALKDNDALSEPKDVARAILSYLASPAFGSEAVVDIRKLADD